MVPMRSRASLSAVLVAASVVVAPGAARAVDPVDKAAAEALFAQGKQLVEAGDIAGAIAKFEASQKLDPGIGTLLYLADAYERAGRTASAWATFLEAAAAAKAAGQSDREQIARTRAAMLKPRLYQLTIALGAGAGVPGLEVRRDGNPIRPEVLGTPVPVDPGRYTIEASAPGKKPWSQTVDVPASAGQGTVTVPALADDGTVRSMDAAGSAAVTSAPAPVPASSPADSAADGSSSGDSQRTAGIVIGAVGLVGLGIGGVLAGLAVSKDGEADEHCEGTRCRDQEGEDLSRTARGLGNGASVAMVVGGAALAAGIIVFLTAPSARSALDRAAPPARSRFVGVAPAAAPRYGGLAVTGRF